MTERRLRVLFLTRYPIEGASSRYRVFQYIPHLEEMGVDCTVQSFMDARMYRLSLSSGSTVKKFILTIIATLKRLRLLASFRQFDVIYMQRELLPFGPPLLERCLKLLGARLAFDYDDALFINKPSRYNPIASFFRSPDKTRAMFRIVNCTVAGNDWLRDSARAEGGRAVTIEVAEDASRYTHPSVKFEKQRSLTIGWLGSPSTAKYLREIEPALTAIAARHPELRWELMGSGDFVMDGVPWRIEPWSMEAEVKALERYDIGLMPLPMQDWSRGKSGGKARTYMASGVVPVVQAIGYNLELIKDGETGFLCDSVDDWVRVLEQLISNAGLRQQVALNARKEVEERFSPRKKAAELAELLKELAAEETN